MAFIVNKVKPGINCAGFLVITINLNVIITTPCVDVTITDGDQVALTFSGAGPLPPAEDAELDSLLSTFACPVFLYNKLGDLLGVQKDGTPLVDNPIFIMNFGEGIEAVNDGKGRATITSASSFFGTEYQKVNSPTVTTTTSTTFQNKITLNTGLIPAGEYRVGFYYSWNHNATDTDFEAQFLEDASPMGEIHKQEPKDSAGTFGTTGTSQRHVAHKVFFTTLTAGVHTFELNYRTDAGGDESSIWDAVVEIWRVS